VRDLCGVYTSFAFEHIQTLVQLKAVCSSGFATSLNLDTLTAAEGEARLPSPDDATVDKIHFLVNNLSQQNFVAKAAQLNTHLAQQHVGWFAQYMVVKRASIEPNFHVLYLGLITSVQQQGLVKEVVRATVRNVNVLLASEKIRTNSGERSLLKNLGSWLGQLTLSRNKPLLMRDLDPKTIVYHAYESGRMIAVIPFVAKLLESSKDSIVFKAPNPWLMAILGLLVEIYNEKDLKLNLKFEVGLSPCSPLSPCVSTPSLARRLRSARCSLTCPAPCSLLLSHTPPTLTSHQVEMLFKHLAINKEEVPPTNTLHKYSRDRDGNSDWAVDKAVLLQQQAAAAAAAAAAKAAAAGVPQPASAGAAAAFAGMQPGSVVHGGSLVKAGESAAAAAARGSAVAAAAAAAAAAEEEAPPPATVAAMVAANAAPLLQAPLEQALPNMAAYVHVNATLALVAERLQLKRLLPLALERAIREIVALVVRAPPFHISRRLRMRADSKSARETLRAAVVPLDTTRCASRRSTLSPAGGAVRDHRVHDHARADPQGLRHGAG
jgi:hypothetical protein